MRPNPEFPVDLVTFTGEILNKKLHFLYSESFCNDDSLLRKKNPLVRNSLRCGNFTGLSERDKE